jgi:LAO/AO transport system kinase
MSGEGIDDLVARLNEHAAWLAESGEGERRRVARARDEITVLAVAQVRERLGALPGEARLEDLAVQVASGKLDPYSAADQLVSP